MVHFFVGVAATAVLWLLAAYVRRNQLHLNWWRWALTVLGVGYAVFVVEVIVGFLAEGEPRAALVRGVLLGIVAVAWAVLLGRFVFKREAHRGR
jgi:VIT1/CCC1 family predicted Fe2+/Mn2+ transporter